MQFVNVSKLPLDVRLGISKKMTNILISTIQIQAQKRKQQQQIVNIF